MKYIKTILFVGILISVFLTGCGDSSGSASCSGTQAQGWSGFVKYKQVLCFGSMEGRVIAIDPVARSENKTYPAANEWSYLIKTSVPGSACGAMCSPSSGTSQGIYDTPAVTGGLVYVGTYNGKIYAINADRGVVRWIFPRESYETVGSIIADIVTDGQNLYFVSSNRKIYSIDAATGDFRWEHETEGKIWVAPAIDNGVLYAGNYAGEVLALDADTGKTLWSIKVPSAVSSSLTVFKNSLYFGTFDRNLYSIDKNSGREIWKFTGGNWFWAKPIVDNGRIYAACLDHKVYSLDASTGKELWQFETAGPVIAPIALTDSYVLAVCDKGILYKIKAENGTLEKEMPIGFTVMSPPYTDGDMVYIYARDHNVYAVDTATGTIKWKFSSFLK